jgi:hypothetical protein
LMAKNYNVNMLVKELCKEKKVQLGAELIV